MEQLLTMRDIADLARVARPVVTTWRRRYRTSPRPFPAPHSRPGERELFRRDDVIAWLEQTERGNNPNARAEAGAGAVLAHPSLEAAAGLDAFSAMLTLRAFAATALTGLSQDELLELADAADPDDTTLRSELEAADDLRWLAEAAEQLLDSSWNLAEAHQRLLARHLPALTAQTVLGEPARRVLVSLVAPLLRELGEPAALLDATGCRFDLLADLAGATEAPVILLDGNTRSHRLTRRTLRLAQVIPTLIEPDGGWSAPGATLNLAVLPSPAHPAATELQQFSLIEDVAVQLTGEQALLVLAPAATLTDPLPGPAGTRRDELLRAGHVRAIVRMPPGLLPGRSREAMALWLVTVADATAPAERRTLVADLSAAELSAVVIDGLASDLLAAWQGAEGARRRAWAQLHPEFTTSLLATAGSLVPPPATTRDRQASDQRTGADWIVELADRTAEHLPSIELAIANDEPKQLSLAHAQTQGLLRVLAGQKLAFELSPIGASQASVPVWDADSVADPQARKAVDRLALHRALDPVLTEPGDLVFVNRPRPRAVVDADGGAWVVSPVRVLRINPRARLVPAAVAARINQATGTDWRTWPLALVPDGQRDTFAAALEDLQRQREQILGQLASLEKFTADLTTAVESGQLRLTTKEHHGQANR